MQARLLHDRVQFQLARPLHDPVQFQQECEPDDIRSRPKSRLAIPATASESCIQAVAHIEACTHEAQAAPRQTPAAHRRTSRCRRHAGKAGTPVLSPRAATQPPHRPVEYLALTMHEPDKQEHGARAVDGRPAAYALQSRGTGTERRPIQHIPRNPVPVARANSTPRGPTVYDRSSDQVHEVDSERREPHVR